MKMENFYFDKKVNAAWLGGIALRKPIQNPYFNIFMSCLMNKLKSKTSWVGATKFGIIYEDYF